MFKFIRLKGFVKNIFYWLPWFIEICNVTIHTNWKHCVWWGFTLYPSSLVVVQHIHLASINCNAKPFMPKNVGVCYLLLTIESWLTWRKLWQSLVSSSSLKFLPFFICLHLCELLLLIYMLFEELLTKQMKGCMVTTIQWVTSVVDNDGTMYVGGRKQIDKLGSILMMCIRVTMGIVTSLVFIGCHCRCA